MVKQYIKIGCRCAACTQGRRKSKNIKLHTRRVHRSFRRKANLLARFEMDELIPIVSLGYTH